MSMKAKDRIVVGGCKEDGSLRSLRSIIKTRLATVNTKFSAAVLPPRRYTIILLVVD